MSQIYLVALACLFGFQVTQAQSGMALVPKPVTLTSGRPVEIFSALWIISDSKSEHEKQYLQRALQTAGFNIASKPGKYITTIRLSSSNDAQNPEGFYNLEIDAKGIAINAAGATGIFYGIQTLLQIISHKPNEVAAASITDYPRFAYRGMHLDVCRHFFSVKEVMQYINYLAAYKFNRFHWHLTDDQGWRIEIKQYPKLTSVGGYRNGTIIGRYPGTGNDSIYYGGFYTQQEIKDVVQYAAERHIEVIPEIEMPGHASAAIAAYPALSCFPEEDTQVPPGATWAGSRKGKQVQQTWGVFEDVFNPTEYTFTFLQNVLDEVIPLFPSKYIHIGGDECPKDAWKRSPFCQQLIKEKGLKDEQGLQSYFIERIEKYINAKGKNIIGWDEILEGGLAPNATVMSWRGEEGGIEAARQNHDVIMTPGGWMYFDHSQSSNEDSVTIGGYTPLEKVYAYNPVPAALDSAHAKYIHGGQANLWTEYIGSFKKIEYMIFPRLLALSEVLWTKPENKDWKNFEQRLPAALKTLEHKGINYSKAYFELVSAIDPAPGNNGLLWSLSSTANAPIMINFNNGDSVWNYTGPQHVNAGVFLLNASSAGQAFSQRLHFNMATGKKVSLLSPPSKSYPGNGAFSLVDAVVNEKGLLRAREIIGFSGTDMEAVIDLDTSTTIHEITLFAYEQKPGGIHPPALVAFLVSEDGESYSSFGSTSESATARFLQYSVHNTARARFIKVIAKNAGIIQAGEPGAGKPAWLFVHEISVK